jgi:hypothetical protein
MAEIVNLRRARKAKGRAEKAREAEANRVQHGVAKPVRDLAKARAEKDAHALDVHRIDDKK